MAATSPGTCYTPDFAQNTDGIDPGGSRNVLIAYSYISDGDELGERQITDLRRAPSYASTLPGPGALAGVGTVP